MLSMRAEQLRCFLICCRKDRWFLFLIGKGDNLKEWLSGGARTCGCEPRVSVACLLRFRHVVLVLEILASFHSMQHDYKAKAWIHTVLVSKQQAPQCRYGAGEAKNPLHLPAHFKDCCCSCCKKKSCEQAHLSDNMGGSAMRLIYRCTLGWEWWIWVGWSAIDFSQPVFGNNDSMMNNVFSSRFELTILCWLPEHVVPPASTDAYFTFYTCQHHAKTCTCHTLHQLHQRAGQHRHPSS